ncbi:Serine/threonine-protein kinase AFC2 [Capsicum chinense]|nr:Serine/threonine-protein kinase AFC2 [Capsicum chinense]
MKNYVHLYASLGWNSLMAIKIIRGMKKYHDTAMIEVAMLQQLVVYKYETSLTIVFEKLGPSLYDFLRKNNYHSFSIDLVREIGRQLLDFMHDLHLIHTYLKPENILLTFPEYVKVPDYKVSSRSPKYGSYYKRIPKLSGIKVLDGPTLMIYGVLGVSLWNFVRPPDKKFHIYGNSQLGSWVIPLFEDYNDNMDVLDENINEDAPLSYREYENFCFIRKQLLQIENQQSTLLDLLQRFNGSSQRKKRIARDDETKSNLYSVAATKANSYLGKVDGPDLKSFVQQFSDASKGNTPRYLYCLSGECLEKFVRKGGLCSRLEAPREA